MARIQQLGERTSILLVTLPISREYSIEGQ